MVVICIKDGCLVTPYGPINEDLWIENRYIKAAKQKISYKKYDIIDAKDCYVTPGLLDIHVHGGVGCSFLDCSIDKISTLKKDLIKHGITAIMPTIMTAPVEKMCENINFLTNYIQNQEDYLPDFLGLNLEGPFLSPDFCGIHSRQHVQELNTSVLEKLLTNAVKIITLAPELDKKGINISYLNSRNIIVSMGHSGASYEEALNAVEHGTKLVTHLYNAMKPFHHRSPGIISTALLEDSVYVELIADGVHVDPAAIKLTLKIKPKNKVILVSDSIALRDCPAMDYYVGDQKIFIKDNKAVNAEGIISGSIVTLDQSVRNLVKWGIADFPTAINYAVFNPAKLLNLSGHKICYANQGFRGCIYNDCRADIVLWDKDSLKIKATIVNGRVYEL